MFRIVNFPWTYYGLIFQIKRGMDIFKIHVRRAAAEDILKFTCICVCVCMYVFVYLCVYLCVSRLLAKRKTIQTWKSAHILPLTLPKNVFFFKTMSAVRRQLA